MANPIFKQRDMQLDTFIDKNVKLVTSFSQGDRISDKLVITLTNDGAVMDITDATQVRVDFRKPDKKLVFQYATIEDKAKGIISVILNTQTLAAPGTVEAEVVILLPTGKAVVTKQFSFHVNEAIAGDTSLESSNDYPMLVKAIELGDRMTAANVTPAQIVDAGALAANALPKAGGDMTGSVAMAATTTNGYRFGTTSTLVSGLNVRPSGAEWETFLYDNKTSNTVWTYKPSTGFTVGGLTNLVKKTGDTMTGMLDFASTRGINFKTPTSSFTFATSTSESSPNILYGYDNINKKTFLDYNANNGGLLALPGVISFLNTVNLASSGAQLRLNNGAQSIRVDQPSDATSSARGFAFYEDDTLKGGIGRIRSGTGATEDTMYVGWGTSPWQQASGLSVSKDFLRYKGKDVAMRDKDGIVDLTLTADGAATDPGTTNVAIRRGNTVTLRLSIRRNVNSTDAIVATLPADMRPSSFVASNVVASDGTVVRLTVEANGNIKLGASGKDVVSTMTYVVD